MTFRLSSPHVNFTNPSDVIYVKGNESTDGSIRLVPDVIGEVNVEVQLRTAGVWNTTGIQVSGETVQVGLNTALESGGDWLIQETVQSVEIGIIPHLVFSDTGPELSCKFTKPGPLLIRQIANPSTAGEFTGTLANFTGNPPVGILNKSIYFMTGSTAATQPVRMQVAINNFAELGGELIYDRLHPASDFPANTEINLPFIGFLEGNPIRFHYFSLSSDEDFSLLADATNLIPWVATDLHQIITEDLVTSTVGMNRVLITNAGDTISDNEGNLVLDQEPPV
tara:strand:+ start:14780 stop:15622 length:843 start_codon:yes stop_codon:yes gene_type:complete